MNRVRSLLLGASMAALAASAVAADGPTALLPADSGAAFKLSGAAGESARMNTQPVTGQPFKTLPFGNKGALEYARTSDGAVLRGPLEGDIVEITLSRIPPPRFSLNEPNALRWVARW